MEATIEQLSAYELERGKPMPTLNHAIIQANLIFILKLRYRQPYSIASEINLTMPERPDTVPDVAIFPKLQLNFLHDTVSMTQMPLTAIEIVSPSQSDTEILLKFERYFKAGVQSCWLVMPGFQAISVYTAINKYHFFSENDTLTDPVTGIELMVSDAFTE